MFSQVLFHLGKQVHVSAGDIPLDPCILSSSSSLKSCQNVLVGVFWHEYIQEITNLLSNLLCGLHLQIPVVSTRGHEVIDKSIEIKGVVIE